MEKIPKIVVKAMFTFHGQWESMVGDCHWEIVPIGKEEKRLVRTWMNEFSVPTTHLKAAKKVVLYFDDKQPFVVYYTVDDFQMLAISPEGKHHFCAF